MRGSGRSRTRWERDPLTSTLDRREPAPRSPRTPTPTGRSGHRPDLADPDPLPVPASGAWRPGDPDAGRRWFDLPGPLPLADGGQLPEVRLAYETWGTLAPDGSNAVLVMHALTGDAHLAGPSGPGQPSRGWWDALLRPGAALDPGRWFVVAPNAIGGCQGSTGPSSDAPDGARWGSRFPRLAMTDLVLAERALADHLGVAAWAAVVGGSMGGMRALQWAVDAPERVRRLFLLACPAFTDADALASITTQLLAITGDRNWRGGDYYDAADGEGPHAGLGLARRIAHLTYRSPRELTERFGRAAQPGEDPAEGGRYAVQSYLDHHAAKLARRFDAASYVALSQAMLDFDIGSGQGLAGVARSLSRVTARTEVAAIDSDRLFPVGEQRLLAGHIPGAGPLRILRSRFGHDGFLLETAQVDTLLADLLAT